MKTQEPKEAGKQEKLLCVCFFIVEWDYFVTSLASGVALRLWPYVRKQSIFKSVGAVDTCATLICLTITLLSK